MWDLNLRWGGIWFTLFEFQGWFDNFRSRLINGFLIQLYGNYRNYWIFFKKNQNVITMNVKWRLLEDLLTEERTKFICCEFLRNLGLSFLCTINETHSSWTKKRKVGGDNIRKHSFFHVAHPLYRNNDLFNLFFDTERRSQEERH